MSARAVAGGRTRRAPASRLRAALPTRLRAALASRLLAALATTILLAMLLPAIAGAHGRSTSLSSFDIDDGDPVEARITLRAPWAELQRAVPGLAALGATPAGVAAEAAGLVDRYLQEHVRLLAGGVPCVPVGAVGSAPTTDPSHVGRRWRVLCEEPGALAIESTAFLDAQPAHLHLARVRRAGADPVEAVLVLDRTRLALAEPGESPEGATLLDYVILGVEHIFTGTDHVLFVLALLLVGATLGEVATVVTGFTAAHSVTLALGVLGVLRPPAAAVEALIGFSIVVVALENFLETTGTGTRRAIRGGLLAFVVAAALGAALGLLAIPVLAVAGVGIFSLAYFALLVRSRRPGRLRWLVAFVFGLVHGFGFAGVLAETALPAGRTAQALLGFNAGVELGQLAIVAALWPPYRWLVSRRPALRPLVIQSASAVVLAAGLFWFLTRAATLGGA